MTPASLQRLQLETTRGIYQTLPLHSIRLVNFSGATGAGGAEGPGASGLSSLLPGLLGLQTGAAAAAAND
jgi:hypothetical protein